MEVTLMASSSAATHSLSRAPSQSILLDDRILPRRYRFSSNGSSFFLKNKLSFSVNKRDRRSLVVAAAKKRKNKGDEHSFVPKPDEATGPFPEAVLLKKKTVKEDGRVLPEFADDEEEELYQLFNLQLESDLDLERMRHYEVVYLIHEDHVDEVDSVISKVEEFIREKKGRIWRLNNWGMRRLAYKIRKAKNANYVLMNFELEARWINDFKSMLDKDQRIIRHLVMKRDEAITEDCPPPPEFYTFRAQGTDEDDEMDDEDLGDEDQDWDDDVNDDGSKDIILINEDENDKDDSLNRRARTLQAEKITR